MDHRYMRPPPPPQAPPLASDPYQRPPHPLPPPSNHPWTYPTTQQFQYQPQPQHSPSPPPPPPPPSSYHAQCPPQPPPPPYAHQPPPYPGNPHYPPPRPPHIPQSYPQDWGGGSWSQHQNWQYPNNANEEDWAAKARAWAAAKVSTDNQQPQSQFVSAARPEGQHYLHNQVSQPVEQYPVEMGPPNGLGLDHSQESHNHGSGQSSFTADMHLSYAANDRNSVAPFPQHDKSSISPSGRQQEVPSSYSSIPGNDAGNKYEGFNSSLSRPVLQHHIQPQPQHNHLMGSQPVETMADPSDQPLNFAPHFNCNMDSHLQPNYMHSSGGPGVDHTAISANYAWPPSSAPGAFYPPVATNMSSGPQVDHPTMFPTGPGFQPNFGVGSGLTSHAMSFSGDAYGVSGMSERPKKASVPNWLREEIIKNKAVITGSAVELPKEGSQYVDDDDVNDRFSKRDQADSRSVDSSRSTEDEDEEEVEAARTAAINQEIKRILTEVLLKVTDELFDEIATKVLNEDDLSIAVETDFSNDQELPPTKATLTPKASAKILIPSKAKELDAGDASENSISGLAGNVLGLVSYASDEEDEEIQNKDKLQSKENSKHLQSSSDKDNPSVLQNGSSREVTEEQSNDLAKANDTGAANDSPSNDSQRGFDGSKSNKSVTEKASARYERPVASSDAIKSRNNDFQTSHIGNRPDKNDGHENKKSSTLKDHSRSESLEERPGKKGDEVKHSKGEKTEYHNSSKDKRKEKDRSGEKTKDTESRKWRSPVDGNEGAAHTGREKRNRDKDEKRRDKTRDEEKERSRHDTVNESSRHKRHMPPSVDRRDRESKNKSAVGCADDYSDQSSDDSKRRSSQSKRNKSPSPTRQRKRQVSRSPPSKHSKHRHSPYSSLEPTRGKRSLSSSRSRSPVRRRRQ